MDKYDKFELVVMICLVVIAITNVILVFKS